MQSCVICSLEIEYKKENQGMKHPYKISNFNFKYPLKKVNASSESLG